jgi:hypothetical protein
MTSPELTPDQRKALRLAKIFDLRSFIGSLLVVFGVIVTLDGVTASPADIEKAAGINLALWTGLFMLTLGVLFVLWTLLAPPEIAHAHEMSEDDLPEQLRHHGLEEIPEHGKDDPEPPRRRRPPGH